MNYDNINNAGMDVVGINDKEKPSDFDNFFIKKFLRLQNYQTSIISDVNNTNWISSEHFNLSENKDDKINNRKLLSLENNDQMSISQSTKIQPNNNGIITGTLASSNGSVTIKGTNTKFNIEFKSGDVFIVNTSIN